MRNVSHKTDEIEWGSVVEADRPQATIRYGEEKTRFACRVTKAIIQTHIYNT